MDIKPVSQRETCLFYNKPLMREQRTIFIPKRHQAIVNEIYNNLEIPFTTGTTGQLKEKTIMDFHYFPNWGFGTIEVSEVGHDFLQRFNVGKSGTSLNK